MSSSEFEKQVQHKMEELKLAPGKAVWDKIEEGLPKKNKKRRWLFLLLFLGLVITACLTFWDGLKKNTTILQADRIIKDESRETGKKNNEPLEKNETQNVTIYKTDSLNNTPVANIKINTSPKVKINISSVNARGINLVDMKKIKAHSTGKTKIKVQSPIPFFMEEDVTVEKENNNDNVTQQNKISITDTATKEMEEIVFVDKIKKTDTIISKTKDSVIITNVVNEKKKQKEKWLIGMNIAAGVSAVNSGFFNDENIFETASPIGTGGTPGTTLQPNKPTASIAFNIGFNIQKEITKRWKFNTGLNYNYQSNVMAVGLYVDSALISPGNSVSAGNYYRIGDAKQYRNKFHLLEIPFLFEYKFSKRSPLYAEVGSSLALLLNSNALVFNGNSAIYYTSPKVFNKINLFFIAGAGFEIAQKTKHPLLISYQFKYGISSVTKTVFAREHFINSMLSIKMPLKK